MPNRTTAGATRALFAVAAAYGLVATIGLYFRVPLTAGSLWLYAFAGAAAATQIAYALIATDPVRYRAVIPVGIASKLSFGIPATLLYARGAVPAGVGVAGVVDLVLVGLFVVALVRLSNRH